MGRGPFFDRPFTAGDEGWFGLDRPLVGSANGVMFTVDADSVRDIAAEETLPRQVQNKIDELADTREEMRNTKEKIQKMSTVSDVFNSPGDAIEFGFLSEASPMKRQIDKLRRLKTKEKELIIAIETADVLGPEREDEVVGDIVDVGDLSADRQRVNPPTVQPGFEIDELADAFETVLNRQMRDLPISTGPVVEGSGDKLTVVMTMVSMDQADVNEARDRIERLGAQVESQEFFQT